MYKKINYHSSLQEKKFSELQGDHLIPISIDNLLITSDYEGEYLKLKEDYSLDPKNIEEALGKGIGYIIM